MSHLPNVPEEAGYVLHSGADLVSLTKAEAAGIEARRQWELAECDPDKLAELMAWETLRQAIGRLMAREPLADVMRSEDYTPEQEAAFDTAARLLRELKEQEAATIAIWRRKGRHVFML